MSKITPREGEEVLMHLRKSIFVLGRQMSIFGIAVLFSAVLLTMLYKYPAASVAAAILLLLALFYAFYYFIIWYYDVYAITNIRVVALGRKSLFNSEFSEANYMDVNGITFQVKGIMATVFQYGNVTMNLSGGEKFELVNLVTPGVVQETLKNLVDATRRR